MSKTKTIELSEPVKSHRGMIKKIMLREPKYSDFIDLGMPTTWVSLADGGGFSQETPSVLGAWIERLADIDPNFLGSISLRDTLALRGAVLGFFIEAVTPVPTADADQSLASEEFSPSNASSTSGPSTI
jgi:hypothetical protein